MTEFTNTLREAEKLHGLIPGFMLWLCIEARPKQCAASAHDRDIGVAVVGPTERVTVVPIIASLAGERPLGGLGVRLAVFWLNELMWQINLQH